MYCTGRSSRGGAKRARATPFDLEGRPETIEETAELVTRAGGEGIAIRADHDVTDEVRNVTRAISDRHGHLDVLVNDIWGGDALVEWGTPVSELDVEKGRKLLEQALFTHVITAKAALPLLRRGSVMSQSGQVLASWTLARHYGLSDEDGTRPDFGTHAEEDGLDSEQDASHDRFVAGAGGYPLGKTAREDPASRPESDGT